MSPKKNRCSDSTVRRIRFAEGWLGLGNAREAAVELRAVPEVEREHPDVLALTWSIHAANEEWGPAFGVACRQLEVDSEDVRGWINQSYSLRRMPGGGIEQAMEALLPAQRIFPKEVLIPYNLACYECQLGHIDEAIQFFQTALKNGDRRSV